MKAWQFVLKKETMEMFRDRRVITNAFLMPIFVMFLIAYMFSFLISAMSKEQKETIALIGSPSNEMITKMRSDPKYTFKAASSIAEAKKLVVDGGAKLALQFSEDFDVHRKDGSATITAVFDSSHENSEIALQHFQETVQAANKNVLLEVFAANHLPANLVVPIKVTPLAAEQKKGLGASMFVSILPYLIVLLGFSGGMAIVADLVAGEKERGTLETLLITPITRTQITLGKFFALTMVCLGSSLTVVAGVVLMGASHIKRFENLFPDGIHVSAASILSIALVLIPLVMMFAGLMLTISAHAKNMREAQTYLALMNLVVLMPAMMSQFIGFTDIGQSAWVRWVPILSSAMAIREALLEKVNWPAIAPTILVSLALAAASLLLVIKMFHREQILTRT